LQKSIYSANSFNQPAKIQTCFLLTEPQVGFTVCTFCGLR